MPAAATLTGGMAGKRRGSGLMRQAMARQVPSCTIQPQTGRSPLRELRSFRAGVANLGRSPCIPRLQAAPRRLGISAITEVARMVAIEHVAASRDHSFLAVDDRTSKKKRFVGRGQWEHGWGRGWQRVFAAQGNRRLLRLGVSGRTRGLFGGLPPRSAVRVALCGSHFCFVARSTKHDEEDRASLRRERSPRPVCSGMPRPGIFSSSPAVPSLRSARNAASR